MATSFILQAPAGRAALARGMGRMTRLLQVTLGPVAGTVAIAPLVGQRPRKSSTAPRRSPDG